MSNQSSPPAAEDSPAGSPRDSDPSISLPAGLGVAISAIAIVVGILILAMPRLTLLGIALLVGLELIVAGVFRVVLGIGLRAIQGWARALVVVLGLLTVVAGVICLLDPGASLLVVAIFLGVGLISDGISVIAAGWRGRADESRTGLTFAVLSGAVSVIAGLIVLIAPGSSLLALTRLAGWLLIIIGVFHLIGAVGHHVSGRRSTT